MNIRDAGQERWLRRYVYWIPALHLEGPLGRERGAEGAGGVGPRREEPKRDRLGDAKPKSQLQRGGCGTQQRRRKNCADTSGRGSQEAMTATAPPNGWAFWPDAKGLSSSEVTLREELEWREYLYEELSSPVELVPLGVAVEDLPNDDDDSPYVSTFYRSALLAYTIASHRRCFNCGSTSHIVNSCPEPRNQALISLSRAYYQFYNQGAGAEPQRLHIAEEKKLARLKFLDDFVPGEVKGEQLREALGLKECDPGENAPWLDNMLIWGYPPGWARDTDQRQTMLERIVSTGDEEFNELDSFGIFGDNVEESLQLSEYPIEETKLQPESESSLNLPTSNTPDRRWVTYRTTLFSSDRLPVYNGRALPTLHAESEELATLYNVVASGRSVQGGYPWRRPGAFKEGAADEWLESCMERGSPRTNAKRSRRGTTLSSTDSDMDCSD